MRDGRILNEPGEYETKESKGTTWRAAGAAALIPEEQARPLVERFDREHPAERGKASANYVLGRTEITVSRDATYDKPTMRLTNQSREARPC